MSTVRCPNCDAALQAVGPRRAWLRCPSCGKPVPLERPRTASERLIRERLARIRARRRAFDLKRAGGR